MLYARVQAFLHPAGQHRVRQHGLRSALYVVHVDPAAFALERGKLGQQQPGQTRHALLVVPCVMLVASACDAQHQVLRFPHQAYAADLFAKLARCAFFSQQRQPNRITSAFAQRRFKLYTLG